MTANDDFATPDRWTYWCPPEGSHISHPNELWVGTVNEDGDPTYVAAMVPALHDQQQEATAALILAALAGALARPSKENTSD